MYGSIEIDGGRRVRLKGFNVASKVNCLPSTVRRLYE